MKQSSNLGLALYDKTDLMNITGLENSLNHNMELIDSEISKLWQNKAPAGYGLGGEATEFVTGDFNNYIKGGWYGFSSTAGIANVPLEGIGYGVLKVSHGSQIIYQEVTAPHWGLGHIEWVTLIRVNTSKGNSDAWSPWEWVNPPMILGVEYRTTERYLEKPVYVKVVDCGKCPGSGFKDIQFDTSGVALPIRCYGNWNYDGRSTIPFETNGSDRMVVGMLGRFIRITTGGKDFSEKTCTVTVYYTKTTD